MLANVNDQESLGDGYLLVSHGQFRGGSFGVGYATSTNGKKRLGYFLFATANSISGGLELEEAGVKVSLSNMQNKGFTLSGGASLRLWSMKWSDFSAGIFGGPTVSVFSSKFSVKVSDAKVLGGGDYSATPYSFGAMIGAQTGVTVLGIYLNPYFIYYKDLTDGCKRYNGYAPEISKSGCSQGANYIRLPLTFSAYGINIGIGSFFLSAYSQGDKDASLDAIDLYNLKLSYTFRL